MPRPTEAEVRELIDEMRGRIERNEVPVVRSAELVAAVCEDWLRMREAAQRIFDAAYHWHLMEDDVDTKTPRHEEALEELYLANAELGKLIGEIRSQERPHAQ